MPTPAFRLTVAGFAGLDGVSGPDEQIDDPPAELLGELVSEVASGSLLFFTLARQDDPTGQTYVQVARTDENELLVEHRAGTADQFAASTADERLVREVLLSWRLGSDRWEQALPWRRIEVPDAPAPVERKRRWFGR